MKIKANFCLVGSAAATDTVLPNVRNREYAGKRSQAVKASLAAALPAYSPSHCPANEKPGAGAGFRQSRD
jgi:hypothetical protein